jgi:hypothetical protein
MEKGIQRLKTAEVRGVFEEAEDQGRGKQNLLL